MKQEWLNNFTMLVQNSRRLCLQKLVAEKKLVLYVGYGTIHRIQFHGSTCNFLRSDRVEVMLIKDLICDLDSN